MTNDVKVIIGMPVNGKMIPRTTHSVGCSIIHSGKLIIDFLLHQSCDIVSSRTWIVNEAIKNGATHLLFVDSDMVFPMGALEQLLSHKKEIIGVEYHRRKFPLEGTSEPIDKVSETEIYKAKYAGTGFMLIDLSIFPKLKGPWFNFGRDSQGALALGEDAWFCNTARDAGYDTWIDPTLKIQHIGEYAY